MTEHTENFRTWYKNQLRVLPRKIWNRVKGWRLDAYDEQAIAFWAGVITVILAAHNLMPTVVLVSLLAEFFWFTIWCHGKYRREVKKNS